MTIQNNNVSYNTLKVTFVSTFNKNYHKSPTKPDIIKHIKTHHRNPNAAKTQVRIYGKPLSI
jgi:hypothetical protein